MSKFLPQQDIIIGLKVLPYLCRRRPSPCPQKRRSNEGLKRGGVETNMGHRKVNTRRRRPLPPQKFRKGGGGGNNKLCSEREKKSSEPAPYGPRPKRACFRLQLSGNWSDETFFSLSLHLPPIALGSGLAPRKLLLRSDPPYVEACFLKHRPKNNMVPSIPLPLRSHAAKPTPPHVRTYDITLFLLRPREYAPPPPHSARQGVGV